jgi:hypothetical protein
MRPYLRCLAGAVVLAILTSCSDAQAKHNYFANCLPVANYLNRCLGFGWSDGYHAPGGWQQPAACHAWVQPPAHGWQPIGAVGPQLPRYPLEAPRHAVFTSGRPITWPHATQRSVHASTGQQFHPR